MDFKQEKIFENDSLNNTCDLIFNKINEVFEKTTDVVICGSVAKMLSGVLSEEYEPKDLDFVVRDFFIWRFLRENLQKWFSNYRVVTIKLERIILYTDSIALEFWAGKDDHRETRKLTENIKFISYGNTI